MLKVKILLGLMFVAVIAAVMVDRMFLPEIEKKFLETEEKRLEVANKLTTAKIIQENLNHVRELVFENMIVPGYEDTIAIESKLFHFLTAGVQDLKLKLVSVSPQEPVENGRITTYAYEVEVEGDFFKFGELCSKMENSRRIINVKEFKVELVDEMDDIDERKKNKNQPVNISMLLETYHVK